MDRRKGITGTINRVLKTNTPIECIDRMHPSVTSFATYHPATIAAAALFHQQQQQQQYHSHHRHHQHHHHQHQQQQYQQQMLQAYMQLQLGGMNSLSAVAASLPSTGNAVNTPTKFSRSVHHYHHHHHQQQQQQQFPTAFFNPPPLAIIPAAMFASSTMAASATTTTTLPKNVNHLFFLCHFAWFCVIKKSQEGGRRTQSTVIKRAWHVLTIDLGRREGRAFASYTHFFLNVYIPRRELEADARFSFSATRSCVQCLLLRLLSFFSTFLLMYTHYYISVRTLTSKHTQTHMHDIIQYKSVAHSCTIICCDRFRPCCHFFILFFGAFCVFI